MPSSKRTLSERADDLPVVRPERRQPVAKDVVDVPYGEPEQARRHGHVEVALALAPHARLLRGGARQALEEPRDVQDGDGLHRRVGHLMYDRVRIREASKVGL